MTSRCHAVGLNLNLSIISCERDLNLWKNGILDKATILKFFSYKIDVILC